MIGLTNAGSFPQIGYFCDDENSWFEKNSFLPPRLPLGNDCLEIEI